MSDASIVDAALRLGVLTEHYSLEVRILGQGTFLRPSLRRVHLFDFRKMIVSSSGLTFSECGKALDTDSEALEAHKAYDARRRFLNKLPAVEYVEPPLCGLCARTIQALLGKEST